MSQAAVSIAKCLSELHTCRALGQRLIFARSTSRDVTGKLHAGSKAGLEIPSAPQPCAAVSTLFHHSGTTDGGLFLTQIISTWCL